MSWQDRVQPDVILQSPSGATFTALWAGDSREMEKMVGVFKYPLMSGAVTQDLDAGPDRYPLSFFFEGDDHDLTAQRFWMACRERGPWWVEHPVYGQHYWQMLSVRQEIDLSNVTAISTEWIEPIRTAANVSPTQRVAAVRERQAIVQSDAADNLAAAAPQLTTPSAATRFRQAAAAAALTVKTTLAPLTRTVAEVNATIESVHRGITDTLTSVSLDLIGLAGQIQTMVTLPALVPGSILTRLGYYQGVLAGIVGLTPGAATPSGVGILAVQELVGTTVMAAVAQVVIDGEPTTREEALQILETVRTMHDDMTASLDAGQALYDGQIIHRQYLNRSDTCLLVSEVSVLLLRRLFDLSVAKRFTLERDRTPIEISLTEGVDYDGFIAANNLTGREILLLPAGREVVVYL
jgi:prophage DNA circulation protein